MLEHQQPLVGLGALIQPPARLEGDERLEIVAHDPRERQVRGRGDEVRQVASGLAAARDEDRAVMRHVPRRRQQTKDADVWRNFQKFPESYKRIRIGWIAAARQRPAALRQRLNYF